MERNNAALKRVRLNSRPYQILKILAVGSGILLISLTSPLCGAKLVEMGVKSYFSKKRFEKEKFLRNLTSLQKRKLINYKKSKPGILELKITKNGREEFMRYKIDGLKLKTLPKWDKKWRIVMFDIPHGFKKARDAFREKLKGLNFYPVQKSVFITPYPCEDEIDFLASFYNIRDFILIFYADRFEGEEKMKNYFKI